MKAKLIGMSAYQGTPTSGTLRIYRAGRYEDGQGNAAVRLEEFKWRAGTAGARGSWGDPFNPAVDAYTVVSAAGEPAPVEGLFEEVFVYADGSERRSLYRKNLIATNLAGTEFDYTEPQGVTTYSGSEPLTFQAARDLLTEGTTKLAEMEQALADNAQAQALATAAAGITPRANLAAITGADGYYRAMDTGEVYQRAGGINTPRPDLKPVPVDRAARVFRVPLIVGNTHAANAAIFNAVAAMAPEGSVLQLPGDGQTYNLASTAKLIKALTIDLNSTNLSVKVADSSGNGSPLFWFAGAQGTSYPLGTANSGDITITLSTPEEAANFAAGDWVVIEDNQLLPRWDGSGNSYGNRIEPSRVASVNAATGVLTLNRPLEWTYTTNKRISKLTPLLSPQVVNTGGGGFLREVNPGVAYTGALVGNAPHLIHIQCSLNPHVDGVNADGWNLHVLNYNLCINPTHRGGLAKNPFRPTLGGHGYFVRYDYCIGGHSSHSMSIGVRHHVDWDMSYDGGSSHNIAIAPVSGAYLTHGTGCKRIVSANDEVQNCPTGSGGWGMGNPQFAADYDFTIINPVFTGNAPAILMGFLSERMTVHNPRIRSQGAAYLISTGARDFEVDGGAAEVTGTNSGVSVLTVRPQQFSADTTGAPPRNIRLRHTKLIAPQYVNGVGCPSLLTLACNGDVVLQDVEFRGGTFQYNQVASSGWPCAPDNVRLIRPTFTGATRYTTTFETTPNVSLVMEGVQNTSAALVYPVRFPAFGGLKLTDYRGPANSLSPDGDVTAAVAAGAYLRRNTPGTYDTVDPVLDGGNTFTGRQTVQQTSTAVNSVAELWVKNAAPQAGARDIGWIITNRVAGGAGNSYIDLRTTLANGSPQNILRIFAPLGGANWAFGASVTHTDYNVFSNAVTFQARIDIRQMVRLPSAATTATAATTLAATHSLMLLTSTANVTLGNAPTMVAGRDGEQVTWLNAGSFNVTLQDRGTLAGSALMLGAATRVLAPRQNITLIYSTALAAWVETGYTAVL